MNTANASISVSFSKEETRRLVEAIGTTCWIAGDGAISMEEHQDIALVDGLQGRLEKALKAHDAENAGTN